MASNPRRRRPPTLNLVSSEGKLKPIAPFQVLSVMMFPADKNARRRFMDTVRSTGVRVAPLPFGNSKGNNTVEASDVGITRKEFVDGRVAGDLLLSLLELKKRDELEKTQRKSKKRHTTPSLNKAIKYTRARLLEEGEFENLRGLSKAENLVGTEWHKAQGRLTGPIHRASILKQFHDYRSVAHLWAAMIIASGVNPDELLPESNATLPNFIGVSNALREACRAIRIRGLGPQQLLPDESTWIVRLPDNLTTSFKLDIPPSLELKAIYREG